MMGNGGEMGKRQRKRDREAGDAKHSHESQHDYMKRAGGGPRSMESEIADELAEVMSDGTLTA